LPADPRGSFKDDRLEPVFPEIARGDKPGWTAAYHGDSPIGHPDGIK
jgi:hypothetical protein